MKKLLSILLLCFCFSANAQRSNDVCIDSIANNYMPQADPNNSLYNSIVAANVLVNNESCIYNYGCTDPLAFNYDADANTDDVSCQYPCNDSEGSVTVIVTTDTYVSQETSYTLTGDNGFSLYYDFTNDDNNDVVTNEFCIPNGTHMSFVISDSQGDGLIPPSGYEIQVCEQSLTGFITFISANSASHEFQVMCSEVYGCTDSMALNFDVDATINDGSCILAVYGCIDSTASNFNNEANLDDGSCVPYLAGCTDPDAFNFNPNANIEDGSCDYDSKVIIQFEELDGSNFYFWALINQIPNVNFLQWDMGDGNVYTAVDEPTHYFQENGTYQVSVNVNSSIGGYIAYATVVVSNVGLGCTDEDAINFDPLATADDGSCDYPCHDIEAIVTHTGSSQFASDQSWSIIDNVTGMAIASGPNVDDWGNGSQEVVEVCLTENADYMLYMLDSDGDGWNGIGSGGSISIETAYVVLVDNTEGTGSVSSESFTPGFIATNNTPDTIHIPESHENTQIINLPRGWSIFSINTLIEPGGYDLNALLDNAFDWNNNSDANIAFIKDYNGMAFYPEYDFNGIGDIRPNQGYYIYSTEACSLSIQGQLVNPEDWEISIGPGYGIMGYPRDTPSPIQHFFENSLDQITFIKDYKGNIYVPGIYDGIGELKPGEGYLIKTNSQLNHTFKPNIESYPANTAITVNNSPQNYAVTPPLSTQNMIVLIKENCWSFIPYDFDAYEIGAFDNNDVLIGSSKITLPTSAITIWGKENYDFVQDVETNDGANSGESVKLKLLKPNGVVVDLNQSYIYNQGLKIPSPNSIDLISLVACPYEIYLEYEENASEYSDAACLTLITLGCMDSGVSNFNPFATSDDGSCAYIYGCTNDLASNYNSDATTDDGSCIINGCTDSSASNYNSSANQDDNSCIYFGCTIPSASNYNPNASSNDNSCIISGCMLDIFPNYNPFATQSDGSCSFSAEEIIIGCTNQDTWTYNPNANFDDGSCLNELTVGALGQGGIVFHIDSENEIAYVSAAEDISGSYEWGCFGSQLNGADDIEIGSGYQNTLDIVTNCSESPIAASVALAYELASYSDWYLPSFNELLEMCNSIGPGSNENLGNLYGWYRSSSEENNSRAYVVGMFSGTCGTFDDVEQKYSTKLVRPIRHFSYSASGCTDPSALNYQPNATQDDNSCIAVVEGCLSSWADNYNPQANTSDNSCYVNGCIYVWADNYNSQATSDDGSCLLAGCNQLWADNYDQNATSNDGSCYLNGCMSQWADNYNAQATSDDGSCSLSGCMLEFAENYNVYVTVDDGSCEISGCTNVFAVNYDLSATQDDGSCTYYNTAHIPDSALLNYLKADYPDAIVNDSLNVDSAYLITDFHLFQDIHHAVSSLEGLEWCTDISQILINGTSISDLSPLYGNTSIHVIQITGSEVSEETLNQLISIQQQSLQSIIITDNTSIKELNILLPEIPVDQILVTNTEINYIDLNIENASIVNIESNDSLRSINGIGDFDVLIQLYITHNPILTSITGGNLSETYNISGWMEADMIPAFYNNPMLTSCCPLGGFPNYLLNSFLLSENGENCNSGAAVNAFYESNCAPGCTDPAALNYNPNISEDDGSCEYCPEIEVVAAVSNISCITNDADVSVTVYPAGNYNFEWSSGQNTSTLYDIPNDSYTVTVTNEDGCQHSLDVFLETPSEISIEANVIDDDLGQCAGEILTTITGGDGTYYYQWYDDNNQTTQNATNLCSGNYLLEVTDGSGCTASASFDVGGGIPWTYVVTGSNHTLFIQDSTIFNLYESEISFGDYIGVFYMDESTGELKCGGYTIWQETQVAFPMWGDDPNTEEKDGFYENDLVTIGVYNNSEGREYFGASIYFNNFPNSQYFVTNGLSSLQEFNGMPSPTWHVENTGNSHSIMLTEFNPFIGEEPLVYGDFIGIFFNDNDGNLRCGGKTIWTGENNSLTAWGDDGFTPEKDGFTEGEILIWKVWKASQLESYTTIPTFSPNFNPGNYVVNGMSVLLSLDINVNQTLNIPAGWSMFSLNIILDDYNTSNILASIVDEIVLVKDFMGMAYLPEYNYNGIGDLNNTEGYQIKLESPQTLTLTGGYIYPENYPLYLPSGWSIVSYLRTEAASAASALAELNENSNLVLAKNYLGMAFLPEFNYNGIGNMAPGQGYQIKLNAPDTLIYLPNNTAYRMVHLPKVNAQTSLCKAPACTDNNMTVVIPYHAWVKLPSEDAEIIALDALGQLVGCAKYTSPVTVLTLWGDDEYTSKKDGMYVGEQPIFKILEHSKSKNLSIQNWSEGSDVYQVNAINVVSSVSALSEATATTTFNEKQLVKIINLLGQEVTESDAELGRLLFRVYDDGSVEKFIK